MGGVCTKSYYELSENEIRVIERIEKVEEIVAELDIAIESYIRRNNKSLSKACRRTFGSIENALCIMGYESIRKPLISDEELLLLFHDCYSIDNDGYLTFDDDFINNLVEIYSEFYEGLNAKKIKKLIRYNHEIDRLEKVVEVYGIEIRDYLFPRPYSKKWRQINTIIEKSFESFEDFYNLFQLNKKLSKSYNRDKFKQYITLGKEFEKIVGDVLNEVFGDCEYHKKVIDSIPDFVIGNRWYDAKLSRSTALNKNCKTIDKYRKHTDYLTIIYAIDDTEDSDDRADFIHITDYYPYISENLQRKIDAFIKNASIIKKGGGDY